MVIAKQFCLRWACARLRRAPSICFVAFLSHVLKADSSRREAWEGGQPCGKVIDPTAQYRVTCLQFLQTSAARRVISRRRLCHLPVTSRVASLLRQLTHVASPIECLRSATATGALDSSTSLASAFTWKWGFFSELAPSACPLEQWIDRSSTSALSSALICTARWSNTTHSPMSLLRRVRCCALSAVD